MVDDLDDLFSTPRARDDRDLSTDGIESLFEQRRDESLELHDADSLFETKTDNLSAAIAADTITLEPKRPAVPEGDDSLNVDVAPDGSVADMLSALVRDLHQLADDIHRMIGE